MLVRVHMFSAAVLLSIMPCVLAKPLERDGSTKAKAIPLKERGIKAVEEQMQWMMKLHGYTPMLATRDEAQKSATDAVRRSKAGQKADPNPLPQPWEHATLDHNGQWCSYWWFRTPHGRREMYFDTGVSMKTPGSLSDKRRTASNTSENTSSR